VGTVGLILEWGYGMASLFLRWGWVPSGHTRGPYPPAPDRSGLFFFRPSGQYGISYPGAKILSLPINNIISHFTGIP